MKRMTILLAASIVFRIALPGAQDYERQLKAAMNTEIVDGNLKAAIEEYQKLSNVSDRAVAAHALLRLAECYQKLGDSQARAVYERIIREFGDQAAAAATARTKIGSFTVRTAPPLGDRVVKSGPDVTWADGQISDDGRLISYTDWNRTGNLMLHDLLTGTDRALTGNNDWSVGNAYSSTVSPDAKHVAYGWRTYSKPAFTNEVRIISVDGKDMRRVYGSADIEFFDPTDWSQDARWLAVRITRKDRTGQIGLIDLQDGSFRGLRSFGWRGPFKIFFSPDGKYIAYDLPASDEQLERNVYVMPVDGSRETAVADGPEDDVFMGWSPDGRNVLFASDRTGVVGLWAVAVADGKARSAAALVKPNIGSVKSVGVTASGVLHLVKDVSTDALRTSAVDLVAGRLSGTSTVENFRSSEPGWSGDGRFLAYPTITTSEIRVLSVRSVKSGEIRQIRPSLLYFTKPAWMPDGRAVVTWGRDLKGRGGIYRIDTQTGQASFITEADLGRVQLSANGRKIYYVIGRVTRGSGPSTMVERDLESGETRELFVLSEGTGATMLSPDGRSLASVVTDNVAKTSTILVRDVAGGEARQVIQLRLPEQFIAYGAMSWTPDGQALLVVKARNSMGDDPKELWLVPVSGQSPRKLEIDIRGWKYGIALDLTGTQISFVTGESSREVWALESVVTRLKELN